MITKFKLSRIVTDLPEGWKYDSVQPNGVHRRYSGPGGLSIITGLEYNDQKWWLHVSCAHDQRLPSWEEFKMVKNIFIGKDKNAIQILPKESEWISIHDFCLHLFYAAKNGLPDFSHDGGI